MLHLCEKPSNLAWLFYLLTIVFIEVRAGTPGKIRTCDPLIRSQILYPAELRVHVVEILDFHALICKFTVIVNFAASGRAESQI